MKYRSQLTIIADVLNVLTDAAGSSNITTIMQKANLPYTRASPLMAELVEKGLVERVNNGDATIFTITKKGSDFLKEFKRFEMFAEGLGLQL